MKAKINKLFQCCAINSFITLRLELTHHYYAESNPEKKKLRLRTSDDLRPIKCRVISFVSAASNRISEYRQFTLPRRDVFNFSSSPYK
jgi:hypothetical protein